jgi:hypothetical protein
MADGWTLADAASSRNAGASCFGEAARSALPVEPMRLELTALHSRAFGELLPLLLCGEESAVLAFARHAQLEQWGPRAQQDFTRVEIDEERHTYRAFAAPRPGLFQLGSHQRDNYTAHR